MPGTDDGVLECGNKWLWLLRVNCDVLGTNGLFVRSDEFGQSWYGNRMRMYFPLMFDGQKLPLPFEYALTAGYLASMSCSFPSLVCIAGE